MKRFFGLLLFVLLSIAAFGQSSYITKVVSTDTLTNSDTTDTWILGSSAQDFRSVYYWDVVSNIDSLSGTTAGYVIFQISNDGSNWFGLDSITMADQANTIGHIQGTLYSRFARVRHISSGTQSTEVTTSVAIKRVP